MVNRYILPVFINHEKNIMRSPILLSLFMLIYSVSIAQLTTPEKFDFTQGTTFTISQYNGNDYPQFFSVGVGTDPVGGAFTKNLEVDAIYSNANNPGRWRDEGVKTMSYRGGADELQQGCFQFRADVTGRNNISIEWTVRVISFNSNTNYIELQWKDGNNVNGSWNNVSNDLFQQGSTNDPTSYSVILPAAANNLSDLRIRWIYYEIGTGSRDRLVIDDIVINTQPQPLPVELSYFKAMERNNQAQLLWQTQSEQNSKTFFIEKSFDGKTFTSIGEIQAQGTTNIAQNYEFTDPVELNDVQYYRLRQEDFDQTENYSKIISLSGNSSNKLKVYPTLVKDHLTIDLDERFDDNFIISIYSVEGKVIKIENVYSENDMVSLSLESIDPGIYYVNLSNTGQSKTFKIVKSK